MPVSFMAFSALPPEINSTRMYSGPGAGPMLASAAAWDGLAAQLQAAASGHQAIVAQLVSESWLGPASQAMAAAAAPYIQWLAATAAQAEHTATQARAAAAAYESAFAMTVPPSVVAANRAQLLILVATNLIGQNTSAIAAAEVHYAEMWAQDAAAMEGYAAASVPATQLTRFRSPPQTGTAPAGVPQLAALAATPLPAQDVLPDLLGLNVLAVAGLAGTSAGLAMAAGAWMSADESTREILREQEQVQTVEYEILHAIDLFSPLTPSRPHGYVSPSLMPRAAIGEAVSVGKLTVPMNWAANAPAIRSLAYSLPTAASDPATPPDAAPAAADSGAEGSVGTAFSQMALAGMGGSALAGTVSRGRQEISQPAVRAPGPAQPPAESPPDNPVIGIAAEIREFGELRDRGLITQDEYNEQKQRLLGR